MFRVGSLSINIIIKSIIAFQLHKHRRIYAHVGVFFVFQDE